MPTYLGAPPPSLSPHLPARPPAATARLVSDEDRGWYCTLLKEMVNKHLGLKFDNVFEPPEGSGLAKGDVAILRNVLFADFMTQVGHDASVGGA